jgi:hypothetical protein
MSRAGFEPTTRTFQRDKTVDALDSAISLIGDSNAANSKCACLMMADMPTLVVANKRVYTEIV